MEEIQGNNMSTASEPKASYHFNMIAEQCSDLGPSDDAVVLAMKEIMDNAMGDMKKMIEGMVTRRRTPEENKMEDRKKEFQEKVLEKRLERLEKETEEDAKAEEETDDIEEAINDKKFIKAQVDGWFVERGFGFVKCKGRKAFCHAKTLHGGDEALKVGGWVMVKILRDLSRQQEGSLRVSEAWRPESLAEERRIKDAKKKADVMVRTANLASKAAENSREATEEVFAKLRPVRLVPPPGLKVKELAEEEREGVAAEGGTFSQMSTDAACEPKKTTTATQTELRRQGAPWPEVEVKIDAREVEKLLDEYSGRTFGQKEGSGGRFAKVMKAKWLLENFKIEGDKKGLLLRVQREVTKILEEKRDFEKAAEELGTAIDLAKKMAKENDGKHTEMVSELLDSRARIRRTQGKWREALEDWKEARNGRSKKGQWGIDIQWGKTSYDFVESMAHHSLGEHDLALGRAKAASEDLGNTGDTRHEAAGDVRQTMHKEGKPEMRKMLKWITEQSTIHVNRSRENSVGAESAPQTKLVREQWSGAAQWSSSKSVDKIWSSSKSVDKIWSSSKSVDKILHDREKKVETKIEEESLDEFFDKLLMEPLFETPLKSESSSWLERTPEKLEKRKLVLGPKREVECFDLDASDDDVFKEEDVAVNAISMNKVESRAARAGIALDYKATMALREMGPEKAEELLGRVALRIGEIRNMSAYVCKASRRIMAEEKQTTPEDEEDWPEHQAEGGEEEDGEARWRVPGENGDQAEACAEGGADLVENDDGGEGIAEDVAGEAAWDWHEGGKDESWWHDGYEEQAENDDEDAWWSHAG
jgi:hypothetical protein